MAKELMEELKSIGEHEIVVNKKYVTVDDNYTKLDVATDDTIGLIKTGYTQSEKNYPIKVDSSGNAYTNVPWTDTIFEPNVILGNDLYTEVSRESVGNTLRVTLDKPFPGVNNTINVKFTSDYTPNSAMRLCFIFSNATTVRSCYSNINTSSYYMLSDGLSKYKLYYFDVRGTTSNFKIIISTIIDAVFVPIMIGADGANTGVSGLVPAPPADASKKYLRGDATWQSIADFSVSTATASTEGIIKLGSDTVQTIASNSPSAIRNRTYPVQLNSNNQAVVNVPWESGGSYTLPLATDRERGGIQVGYTTDDTNRLYAIELDNEKAYVNIPWTDTTYEPATVNTLGLIKIGFTQSGKNYPVLLNSNNQAYVNVPWTDTKYSLVAATTDTLGGIKIANKRNSSITSKYGTVNSNRYYGVELDSNSKAFVCVPWTDTVVTKTSELSNDSNFVSDSNYVHTDNNYTTSEKTKLSSIVTTDFIFTFTDGTTATYHLCNT